MEENGKLMRMVLTCKATYSDLLGLCLVYNLASITLSINILPIVSGLKNMFGLHCLRSLLGSQALVKLSIICALSSLPIGHIDEGDSTSGRCTFWFKLRISKLLRSCFGLHAQTLEMESNEGERGGLRELWARRRQRSDETRRLWALVEPYRRPPRLMPLLVLNVVGFYTGLVAAAVTEQLYKEKYWEEHPGHAVPIMHPLLYFGPYKVTREDFSEEGSG